MAETPGKEERMCIILAAITAILLVGAVPMELTRVQVAVYTLLYFLTSFQELSWLMNRKGPRPKR